MAVRVSALGIFSWKGVLSGELGSGVRFVETEKDGLALLADGSTEMCRWNCRGVGLPSFWVLSCFSLNPLSNF